MVTKLVCVLAKRAAALPSALQAAGPACGKRAECVSAAFGKGGEDSRHHILVRRGVPADGLWSRLDPAAAAAPLES